jgi:hypothetical protein
MHQRLCDRAREAFDRHTRGRYSETDSTSIEDCRAEMAPTPRALPALTVPAPRLAASEWARAILLPSNAAMEGGQEV